MKTMKLYNLLNSDTMKKIIYNIEQFTGKNKFYLILLYLLLSLVPLQVVSQTDSSAVETTEESTLIAPSITFSSIQKTNTISLKADVSAKVDGSLTRLAGYKIEFYAVTDSGSAKIGEAVTNRNGSAIYDYKADTFISSADGKLHFKANFPGDKTFEAAEEVLAVKRAKLEIIPVKDDSLFTVQLKLIDLTGGTEKMIPEADLIVMVKRMFYPLKIGEGKTDETGMATIEVPNNLPGDEKGNITLLARLEDNEEFGTLETEVIQQWGISISNKNIKQPRALWSTQPPLWMLITFIVLMTLVWGHYFYIIYELFRLKKEHT